MRNRESEIAARGDWITYRAAEQLTGLSRVTLWRLIKSGEVKASKVGTAVRINRRSLEQFMEQRSLRRAAS